MAAQSAQKRQPPSTEIPDRLYFRIGDVAKICSVEPYVLRFWETQFPSLKPNKGGTGQRLYRRREVELALRIKQLVHNELPDPTVQRRRSRVTAFHNHAEPLLPL